MYGFCFFSNDVFFVRYRKYPVANCRPNFVQKMGGCDQLSTRNCKLALISCSQITLGAAVFLRGGVILWRWKMLLYIVFLNSFRVILWCEYYFLKYNWRIRYLNCLPDHTDFRNAALTNLSDVNATKQIK